MLLSRNPDNRYRTHWLGDDGQPACWDTHQECARHKVEQLTQRAEQAEQRAAALAEALGKAASRGLMIYHIASGHTGPAALCETTGCRLERRDMSKIVGPFVQAEHEFVADPVQPLCTLCDLPRVQHIAASGGAAPAERAGGE